ncbi:hypothetical protein [Haloarcula amylolytica]|uniref:hypothetical protein n=1 Tax=Haloarcula amylolytica TaxID=396317 RepID=UPI003C73CFB0
MNRRNVLTGLGGLAISGGALFGSGAFTSVEAQRTVDVNVVTADEISGANEDSDAVADRYVDVRVDVGGSDSVYVDDGGTTDPTSLAPTSSAARGSEGEVSLIANDNPKIIFGDSSNGLPPNSTVNYSDLFTIDNWDNTTTDSFDVTLELSNGGSDFLNIADSTGTINNGGFPKTTISSPSTESLDAAVDTAGDDDTTTLTIRIE